MDIVKYLQSIEEQYAGKPTYTGEVRIDYMANMCWREIKALREQVASLQRFKDDIDEFFDSSVEFTVSKSRAIRRMYKCFEEAEEPSTKGGD